MLKKLLLVSCLFVSINIQAQNADVRIGQLINESNWFELEHELKELRLIPYRHFYGSWLQP